VILKKSSCLLETVFLCGRFAFNELIKYLNLNQYFVSNYLLMWQVAVHRAGCYLKNKIIWLNVDFPLLLSHTSLFISTLGREKGSLGMTRWSSASRLAPEGAPRSHSSSEDFELRAGLEESSMRRAELIQRLREAKGHLDTQTDLLKTKGSQLQQNQHISNNLELKHKVWILPPHQLKLFEINY